MKLFNKFFPLYLLLCGLICFAILEAYARIKIKNLYGFTLGSISELYQFDEKSGLRIPVPNLEVKGNRTHIRINSLGFRGKDLDSSKNENTIRIAALGASTTFCAEVSNNDSVWIELVCATLNAKFPAYRFEAINGGVPGYGTNSSFESLRKRIAKLQPDIVVFYEATNEISFQSKRAAIAAEIIEEGQNHYNSALAFFLSQHSQAFDLLYKNIVIAMRQRQSQGARKLREFPAEYANPFIAQLDSIRQECEKINAPLMIFTFSKRFRREQAPEQRLKNMNTALYYMPWMMPETLLEAFDLYNLKMFEFAQQHADLYVDTLHDAIPGDGEHFVDSVHFTDRGSRMMANRVVTALLREGLVQDVMNRRPKESL